MAVPVAAAAKLIGAGRLLRWAVGLVAAVVLGVVAVSAGLVFLLVMAVGSASASAAEGVVAGAGGGLGVHGWANPGVGPVTDSFGPRPSICTAGGCSSGFHKGADVGASCDAPIRAARDGRVVEAERQGTYGNWVLLEHGSGVTTGYAHIRDGGTLVRAGDTVIAGQEIARVGTTGASTGCHLHFEVRLNGERIDPVSFMADVGITLGADPVS